MSKAYIALLPRQTAGSGECRFGSELAAANEFWAPAGLAKLLEEHRHFCTEEEALARAAELWGWSAPETEHWRQWARVAQTQKLLVTEEELQKLWSAAAPEPAPPLLQRLVVPTRNRPEALRRCVRSMWAQARHWGRSLDITIADDSDSEDQAAQSREGLRSLVQDGGGSITWLGRAEREAWVKALVAAGAGSAELLNWALVNPERLPRAYGVGRNALMVETVGQRVFAMDDDLYARCTRHPHWRPGIAFFEGEDPVDTIFYRNPEEVEKALPAENWDWWGLVDQRLGSSVAGWRGKESLDLSRLGPGLLRTLSRQPARLRVVYLGYAGDSGSGTNVGHLWARGRAVEQMARSRQDYDACLRSREMLRAMPQEFWGDAVFTLGGAMGMDQRELLPPFQPYHRASDGTFAYLLQEHFPGTVFANLPYALRHAPMEDRGLFGDFVHPVQERNTVVSFHDVLAAWLHQASSAVETRDPERRLQRMGVYLAEAAEQRPEDFLAQSREIVTGLVIGRLKVLEELVEERPEAPDYWRKDVERWRDCVLAAFHRKDGWWPADLAATVRAEEITNAIRQSTRQFGELMQVWPAVLAAAREIHTRGHSPARQI